ncbi:hypothetical protein DITRI_Ditri15bG0114300 [Diplodiscus trichospermus]
MMRSDKTAPHDLTPKAFDTTNLRRSFSLLKSWHRMVMRMACQSTKVWRFGTEKGSHAYSTDPFSHQLKAESTDYW